VDAPLGGSNRQSAPRGLHAPHLCSPTAPSFSATKSKLDIECWPQVHSQASALHPSDVTSNWAEGFSHLSDFRGHKSAHDSPDMLEESWCKAHIYARKSHLKRGEQSCFTCRLCLEDTETGAPADRRAAPELAFHNPSLSLRIVQSAAG